MKYLIIGHKFGELGRGGYHISKRFCEEHSKYCEFKKDLNSIELEKLNKQYKKLIFRTQVPSCYSIPVNYVRLRKINHVFYLRENYLSPFYNNCTNGFYYYHIYPKFNNYIPIITNFPVQEINEQQEICLGFYVRKWLTPDSFNCFIQILNGFPHKVNVTVIGNHSEEIKHHNNVLHYNHTHNNIQFFSKITHYFYPTSKHFIDPFPHSVLEAVQCGKTIIFPTIERNFKDGIDDIKDCINWYDKYNTSTENLNKNHPLKAEIWKKFYEKKVFNNDWEFSFDRSKYKNLVSFIEGEVI